MDLSVQCILSLCYLYIYVCSATFFTNNTRLRPGFLDLVTSNGYKGKSYRVITEDGYILRLDRISGAPSSPEAPGKPVVFLQHGLLSCSELFVFWYPKESLAYLLADAGYDVWVSNIRGNTNSRSHATISPDDHKFWNFTLTDLATKDLPALIDFALKQTKQPCLTYIGHSMGTTLSYILLSEKPEYNKKISLVASLAPVALWRYSTMGLLKSLLGSVIDISSAMMQAPDYAVEILAHNNDVKDIFDNYCNIGGSSLCVFLVNSFFGHAGTPQELNFKEAKRVTDYAPAGTSLKILQHYRQMIDAGVFRKFNYGSAGNMKLYGTERPPVYNLRQITSKVALFWVHNDALAHEMNVELLSSRLQNLVTIEPVPSLQFRHSDFYFYKNGRDVIHKRIVLLVNKHHACPINGQWRNRKNGTSRKNWRLKYSPKDLFLSLKNY